MIERLVPGTWSGQVFLDLRNARNWSPGDLEVAVRMDTVQVRLSGR